MTVLIALAAILASAMPIRMVSHQELVKIRDWWLMATLCLGSIWLAWAGEVWLALMALWHLCRWRSPDQHAGLLTWVAIGASWFLLRSLPAWVWPWLPWGWLAIAGYHVAICAWVSWFAPSPYERRPLAGLWRTKAWQGSPAITALFFAMVSPFAPWWFWPILGIGLYLTWSWLAFIGVAVGLAVTHPASAGWVLLGVGVVLGVWGVTWRLGIKAFEWTPRGDSFDSVINRLIVWWLLIQGWWEGPRWLGRGPHSADPALRRWSSQCWIELPTGEACCDPLQHLYEYGFLGVGAVVAFLVGVGGSVGADPWSASLIAGVVMSLGHYPFRQPAIGLVLLAVAAGVGR